MTPIDIDEENKTIILSASAGYINDYPTERQLRAIRNWKGSFKGLWEYIKVIWHWPDWGVFEKTNRYPYKLELHTGGWSGNESIIYAFEKAANGLYWYNCVMWKRGGHYWFEVRKDMWDFDYSKVAKAEAVTNA